MKNNATKSQMTLEIWKLDADGQLTEDAPYFDMPFEPDYTPGEEIGDNDEIEALERQVRKLAHEHRPSIDCAGYRAVCRDSEGGEHMPIDVMY